MDDLSDLEKLIQLGTLPLLIPSFLTALTCPFLFFKYAQKGWKRTGFSMIFILILSDFLYSLIVLATYFFPYADFSHIYRFGFYFCSNFSIYWASAIAFLVYKTLTSKGSINANKLFLKTLLIVLAVTLICVDLMYNRIKQIQFSSMLRYAPLLLGIFLSLIFYLKSIKFLKSQSEFQQGPITLYIKNLQYYCFTQLALYLPSIVFILGMSGIGEDDTTSKVAISVFSEGLASLAGFVNSLIFLKQGKVKEYQAPPQEQLLDSSCDESFSFIKSADNSV